MIDFRYHLVSTIAIFIALAVGIVLGSGPLKDPIDDTIAQQAEQLRQDRVDLRNQIGQLEEEIQYTTEVTEALAPRLTADRLANRSVVVLTAPGTDTALADALTTTITDAGAEVSGTVALGDAWLDPEREGELDTLVADLVLPETEFPEDAGARERANTVLARALVTDDPVQAGQPDADAQALLAGLAELDYLSVDGEPASRATLALLVAPPAPTAPDDASNQANAVLVGLAAALDRQDGGTLVAGAIESAASGGLVNAIRSTDAVAEVVSTVDSAQTAPGRMTVVLGLDAELRGSSGAYGYGPEADTVLPDPVSELDDEQPDGGQPGNEEPGNEDPDDTDGTPADEPAEASGS